MYRRHLLDQLEQYIERYPEDRDRAAQIIEFVAAEPRCFLRSCVSGHVTGSAWVTSASRRHFLLTHHKKLNRWLQLGGHVDGEPEVFRAAVREAQEESGLDDLAIHMTDGRVLPLDVDVHRIPANHSEAEHLHYDVRFLLIARIGAQPRANEESHEVRWFPVEEIGRLAGEESLMRLGRKACRALGPLST